MNANERFAAGVDDTEGAVARAHESARGLDDQRKQLVEVRVGLDEQDCVDQGVESRRIVDFMKRHWSHSPTVGKQLQTGSEFVMSGHEREGKDHERGATFQPYAGTARSRGTRGRPEAAIPVTVTDQVWSSSLEAVDLERNDVTASRGQQYCVFPTRND